MTNPYKRSLVIIIILVHGISLFLFTGMWDSLILKNAFDTKNFSILHNWFSQSGVPLFGYMHSFLGSFSFYPVLYKSLTLIFLIAIGLLTYSIATYFKFSDFEAFVISVVTVIYPVYTLWFDLVLFPLVLSYVFYLAGLCAYLFFEKKYLSLFLALPLFFLAFQIPSFLVFHYGIMCGLFLHVYNKSENMLNNILRFLKLHIVVIVFPVIAFILKSMLFPTYGEYSEYNKIDINPYKIVEGLIFGINNITLGQVPIIKDLLKYLPVVCVFVVIYLAFFFSFQLKPVAQKRNKGIFLLFSFFLLACSLLPYVMVYKIPSAAGYSTRHALLVSLPLGLIIVGILNLGGNRVLKPAFIVLLVLFSSMQIRSKILWENRYLKYASTINFIREKKPDISQLVIFEDKNHIGIKVALAYYEANWIIKQAVGNEKNLGMDKRSILLIPGILSKSDTEKKKFMMIGILNVASPSLTLEVDSKSSLSNLSFFYNCKIKSRPVTDYILFSFVQ